MESFEGVINGKTLRIDRDESKVRFFVDGNYCMFNYNVSRLLTGSHRETGGGIFGINNIYDYNIKFFMDSIGLVSIHWAELQFITTSYMFNCELSELFNLLKLRAEIVISAFKEKYP